MWSGVSCLLEVDIRKFFDTLGHAHLREFLQQRIRDGVVLRLIGKWLNAGVMESGAVTHPEAGSPQGGVVSPVLANVYLHYVLDQWFAREVQSRLKGRAYVVRYEAEDRGQPVHAGGQDDLPMVPVPSPRPGWRATRGIVSKAAGVLRVLRDHGQ
jgi:hypothetical protein